MGDKKTVPDLIRGFLKDYLAQIIGGAVLSALIMGWLFIWHHFNPDFSYKAQPSSAASHFISLGQILNQIERDSHVYCAGGWHERIAKVGLRKCYKISYSPISTYRMTVCTRDERVAEINTPDQMEALRYFEKRFGLLECFNVARKNKRELDVVIGKDAHLVQIKFPTGPASQVAFCGCSSAEETEIIRIIGAMPL